MKETSLKLDFHLALVNHYPAVHEQLRSQHRLRFIYLTIAGIFIWVSTPFVVIVVVVHRIVTRNRVASGQAIPTPIRGQPNGCHNVCHQEVGLKATDSKHL